MRTRLNIAAIFIAVGLGALAVVLLYDPRALIPHPPYYHWAFVLGSLTLFGMILVLGLGDDLGDFDDTDGSSNHPIPWRAVGLAFLASAVASAAFIGATALVDYLDRATA